MKPNGLGDVVFESSKSAEEQAAIVEAHKKQAEAAATAAAAAVANPAPSMTPLNLGEPESKESIGKSGWFRIETDTGMQYFWHKKTKKTVWECPEEIKKLVESIDAPTPVAQPVAPPVDQKEAGEGQVFETAEEKLQKLREEMASQAAKDESASEEEEPAKPKLSPEEQAALDRLENFKKMLVEKGVKPFDKYDKWLPKLMHDKRFTTVPLAKRKALFEQCAKVVSQEKKLKEVKERKDTRMGFKELLGEVIKKGKLPVRTHLASEKLEKEFGDDPRWKALAEKDRTKQLVEAINEEQKRKEQERISGRQGFREMLLEKLGKEIKDGKPIPPYRQVVRELRDEPRWKALDDPQEREKIFDQVKEEIESKQKQQKRKRAETEADIVSARRRRQQAVEEEAMMNLFSEKIKTPSEMSWRDAHHKLRDNDRYKAIKLDEDDKKRVWEAYKQDLMEMRRRAFLDRLTTFSRGKSGIGPEMSFADVKKKVDEVDKSFIGVPESILREAWEEWRRKAAEDEAFAFKQWIQRCEHFFAPTVSLQGPGHQMLIERISGDARYERMAFWPEERDKLIKQRVQLVMDLRSGPGLKPEDMDV